MTISPTSGAHTPPPPPDDPVELLRFDVSYENWDEEIANRFKAFFIRGFDTFHKTFLKEQNVVSLNKAQWFTYIPRMREIIESRDEWRNSDFNLAEPFAINQAQSGLSRNRKPLLFGKAVQTIALLEAIAEDIHTQDNSRPHPHSIYQFMGIEAAVSHIVGFERSSFEAIVNREEKLAEELLDATAQKSLKVFFDLASRKHSVTHKLAYHTQRFISEKMKALHVGVADFKFDPVYNISPSLNEYVDNSLPQPPTDDQDPRTELALDTDHLADDEQMDEEEQLDGKRHPAAEISATPDQRSATDSEAPHVEASAVPKNGERERP